LKILGRYGELDKKEDKFLDMLLEENPVQGEIFNLGNKSSSKSLLTINGICRSEDINILIDCGASCNVFSTASR
jgi:hypothetical protein